uniref:Uncharacterized protein n=1 Tax=Anguilla anguilla TaxID=7936 RepID=A0A0E9TDP1_ANGAN
MNIWLLLVLLLFKCVCLESIYLIPFFSFVFF